MGRFRSGALPGLGRFSVTCILQCMLSVTRINMAPRTWACWQSSFLFSFGWDLVCCWLKTDVIFFMDCTLYLLFSLHGQIARLAHNCSATIVCPLASLFSGGGRFLCWGIFSLHSCDWESAHPLGSESS